MIVPKRVPLSRITANALENEILNKRWESKLPGYRALCKELQVSRKTLVAALKILTRRKLLLPTNGTRARLINPLFKDADTDKPSGKRRNLVILTDSHFLEYDERKNELFERIQSSLAERGWHCQRVDTEEISHHPKEQLEKLHRHNPNARWLIDNPSYETVKWCVRKNIRAVAYGGTMKRIKIPCVGSSLSGLLMQTHQYFQSIGHKRIVHLIERPSEISINIYERYLKKQHLTFRKNYHLPNIDEITAKGFHKMLEGLFSITPPTAIMVSSNRQLIGLLGFCIQHNIKIAEDLSVVISKDSMNIDWFTPGLSYYRRAWERETQELSNLIEHYPANLPEILNVPLQLVNKGSIIPLKKGSSSSRRSHRRD